MDHPFSNYRSSEETFYEKLTSAFHIFLFLTTFAFTRWCTPVFLHSVLCLLSTRRRLHELSCLVRKHSIIHKSKALVQIFPVVPSTVGPRLCKPAQDRNSPTDRKMLPLLCKPTESYQIAKLWRDSVIPFLFSTHCISVPVSDTML
jgi:hypothetical protein